MLRIFLHFSPFTWRQRISIFSFLLFLFHPPAFVSSKSCKAVSQQLPVAQALITALHLGTALATMVMWMTAFRPRHVVRSAGGPFFLPRRDDCKNLPWRKCSKLFSSVCITSCYVCHFASAVAKTKPQCRKQKRFVPSTEVDDEPRSWPNDQSVHTSKSKKLIKALQTFSRSSEKLRFRTPWSPRSSSWYPASMSLPTDGVLEIQVVELNTKIPRNDLLTLFTFQRRNHNGLKEVHAPTARFVSKHPPQESLSNQRQKKHL